ncbi:MAG TPA: Rnase Y domain-containing protein, partial [Patescibacteria group bacterium]|nr:Rnase Y domain-containing protein [Patescibacteria group bacterium]
MSSLVDTVERAGFMLSGAVLCYLLLWWRKHQNTQSEAEQSQSLIEKSRQEAEGILRDARLAANQEKLKAHEEIEQAITARRAERLELERRLTEREGLINSQLRRVVEAEQTLSQQKTALEKQGAELKACEEQLVRQQKQAREELENIAGLSQAAARESLLKRIEQDALKDANTLSRHILEDARCKAEDKAKRIISIAIQRYAGEHTFENTTASIALTGGEDIKGRIIGREGRNIRAFEAATGVTVLIDDTPGSVLLSGFDPVRREIAREAMQRLIADGRIHPTRIEEVVAEVTQEMNETVMRLGDEAVQKAGLPPLAPEVIKTLGRLHFRHSFSQNILDHSVEVAHLMGLMASELGLDVMAAKRAG